MPDTYIIQNEEVNLRRPTPVHVDLSGMYRTRTNGKARRLLVAVHYNGSPAWSMYWGFADIDMSQDDAVEAVARYGDKTYEKSLIAAARELYPALNTLAYNL